MHEDIATPWFENASAVMDDVKVHVKKIEISKVLSNGFQGVHFNLLTLENKEYCVQMSPWGFAVVGEKFDVDDANVETYYETVQSLLDSISEEYRNSFGRELIAKLNAME